MNARGLIIREGANAPRLAEMTTLRLGGRVLADAGLSAVEAVPRLAEAAARLGGSVVCFGGGSNILAADGELPLILVRDVSAPEIEILDDDGKRVLVRAGASVKLPLLLGRLKSMHLGGLEGLTGIPGTVGGAVAMNAGSYGQCVADALESVSVVTLDGKARAVARQNIEFAYRYMGLPGVTGWFMVIAATFAVIREKPGAVETAAREILARKKTTQPITAASAGCVFKNPSLDMPAGKLLDDAGFKGKRLGGMAFSSVHANFLINEGQGTSAQALELIAAAKEAVLQRHGVTLEMEVKLWA